MIFSLSLGKDVICLDEVEDQHASITTYLPPGTTTASLIYKAAASTGKRKQTSGDSKTHGPVLNGVTNNNCLIFLHSTNSKKQKQAKEFLARHFAKV